MNKFEQILDEALESVLNIAELKKVSEDDDGDDGKKQLKSKKSEQSPFARAIRASGFKSQEKLADLVDVDPSTISRFKTGTRKPSFDTMQRLVKRTGSEPESLFPELQA